MPLTLHRKAKPPRATRIMREPPPLPRPCGRPPRARHALLVNPFYAKDPVGSQGKHVLTPTLALTAVAAATPEDWTVELWDENLLQGPPPCDPPPAVAGITVHLTFARRAYELAAWFRAQGCLVVLGGLHASSCPEEVAVHADALAVGDGVTLWPRILEDAAAGRLRPRYLAGFRGSFDDDPAPRRDLLQAGGYLTSASVMATRGCANRCDFCYLSTAGLRVPFRARDPHQVADELRASGEPYAVFLDNDLGSDPDYLRRLCTALEPLDIVWSAAITLAVTDDAELVRAMALSGCTGVFVGFESLTADNLIACGKCSPAPDEFAARVELLHRWGIQVNGSFVLGFDHDGPEVFDALVDWIERARLECATFHVLTPYPGTPLFRRLEREGRILHRDWSRYDTAHCVFRPARMTLDQLEAGYRRCYRRLFSLRSIWRRRPRGAVAAAAYLASSLLYKRANALWQVVIRRGWTARAWRPLVELSRRRHLAWRRRVRRAERELAAASSSTPPLRTPVASPAPPGA